MQLLTIPLHLKYTVSQKNKTPNSWPLLHLLLSDFQNFFTSRLGSKFATNSCLNIPPRFKHVTTLPCEIRMQKNGIILKYVLQLMMDHKVVKNLRCNELLYCTFIIHSAGERIFKIGEHLAKLRAK